MICINVILAGEFDFPPHFPRPAHAGDPLRGQFQGHQSPSNLPPSPSIFAKGQKAPAITAQGPRCGSWGNKEGGNERKVVPTEDIWKTAHSPLHI